MAEAPERLWLWPAEPEDGVDKFVSFPDQPYPSGSTEYIRAEKAEAELAAAQQREARRTFPILKGDGAKIDYQLVADHAEQARSNHGQSVDRLAARGGLSWCELYAVLHNRKWEKVDTNEAMIACRSLEARYLAALSHNGRGE